MIPDKEKTFYEKVFGDKDTKILYHTAEKLKMREGEKNHGDVINDKFLQWRYYSRNVIGQNDGSDNVSVAYAFENESYNTLGDLPGYHYVGGGFNMSANQKGCFEFSHNGKTFYYDLSFRDIPIDPATGDGGNWLRTLH